ncbi:uncharacterized protein Dmul_03380 [Desulfococcus multivorans]|nr:uncharacterized protein Dmul_03380 [Desulfococcus multivorans]
MPLSAESATVIKIRLKTPCQHQKLPYSHNNPGCDAGRSSGPVFLPPPLEKSEKALIISLVR